MAHATGLCIICNKDVTVEDYRREIDCPSKNCPGRVYHEDCIAAYLKRTKYSKDRCTGFPCPAILSNGKECPGYVCKMHNYFPSNEGKKKKKLEAMVAAAAVPKPRKGPPPPKPKTGVQVALAAIKRPEGSPQPIKIRPVDALSNNATPEPRLIPGLNGPIGVMSNKEALRAQVAKLKAEATAPASKAAAANRAVRAPNAVPKPEPVQKYVEDVADRVPQGGTVWDAFSKITGSGELNVNIYDLDRNGGGKFSKLLRKRLEGDNSNGIVFADLDGSINDGASSESDSIINAPTIRDFDESILSPAAQQVPSSEDFPVLAPSAALAPTVPATPVAFMDGANDRADDQTQADAMVLSDAEEQDSDPVVEYDVVYGADDGSYLVLDAVLNAYFRVEDVYPGGVLVETPAEDGNIYTCVAVRRSQLAAREERQRAWLEAQFAGDAVAAAPPPPQGQTGELLTAAAAAWGAAAGASLPCGVEAASGGVAAMGAVAGVEDDDTDVESLMQLLCV